MKKVFTIFMLLPLLACLPAGKATAQTKFSQLPTVLPDVNTSLIGLKNVGGTYTDYLFTIGQLATYINSGTGTVASVTNVDGTLTVTGTPTIAPVISLNLNHSNYWNNWQYFLENTFVLSNSSLFKVTLTANHTSTSNYTLVLPPAQGGSGQTLVNDGSGNLSWGSAGGSGTVTNVSSSDGSISVATPTSTPDVTLNMGHSNSWTAAQYFRSSKFLLNGATSGSLLLSAASVTSTYGLFFPGAQGGAGQTLVNDGAGNLSWGSGGVGISTLTATAPLTGGTITGSSGTIGLGTVGSAGTKGNSQQIPVFTTDAYGRVISSTNTTVFISDPVTFVSDANYVASLFGVYSVFLELPTITASRTLVLGSGATGEIVKIWNRNTSGFSWTIPSGTSVMNPDGTPITTLTNNSFYLLESDGGVWVKMN